MDNGESIYGFGLITKFCDMTRTADRQTGRRAFLKPTDSSENELGESHAPSPFYVSSKGYGFFVDTLRFASFYTGNVAPVGQDAGSEPGGAEASAAELYRSREQRVKTMLVVVPIAKGLDNSNAPSTSNSRLNPCKPNSIRLRVTKLHPKPMSKPLVRLSANIA
jgi:alpha-D-xyloside xylohydrolase